MTSIPRLSGKSRCILRLLIYEPDRYGLQLIEASGGELKAGTVYVTLSRMEKRGLVESWQDPPREGAIGLPRRRYRPTAEGSRVYQAWELAARLLNTDEVLS